MTGCEIIKTDSKFEDLRNYKVDSGKLGVAGPRTKIDFVEGVEEMLSVLGEGRIKNIWEPSLIVTGAH